MTHTSKCTRTAATSTAAQHERAAKCSRCKREGRFSANANERFGRSGSVARWLGGQVACWPSNLLLALLLLQLQSKVRLSDWNWDCDWDWDRAWIYRCKTWNRVGYRRRQLLESFAGRAGHGARVAARGMWQLQHIQPVAIYTSGLAGDIWLL